jgi:hypothetical protein
MVDLQVRGDPARPCALDTDPDATHYQHANHGEFSSGNFTL